MAQGILIDRTYLLEVNFTDEYCQVNYGFHTFEKFHKDDLAALRISVVQLVRMGINKSRLARIFNINRKSIGKWKKIFNQAGHTGLVNMKNGRSKKCNEIISNYIFNLHKKLGNKKKYKEIIIDEVQQLFNIKISRETLRKTLNNFKNTDKEKDPECKNTELPIEEENSENNNKTNDIKNGGVLLALPLLDSYNNMINMIPKENDKVNKSFSFKDIVMTISMLLTGNLLKNEEQIKMNESKDMGAVIRKKSLPSLRTVRRSMSELIKKVKLPLLKKNCASILYKKHINRMIFYLDGHFMPYYGKNKLLYGYNSLRRIAMKGVTSYVVNSESGRPIYQILSDNFDNFNENIIKIVKFLKKICYKKKPLLVFDRGGFGKEFFIRLYNKASFICWSKGKPKYPRKGKWKRVFRYIESNVYGDKIKEFFEVKEEQIEVKDETGGYFLRRLFIKKENKISTAVTNEQNMEVDELVRILTRRWGAQENVFKELKKYGYDNIHSYNKCEYSEKILLENGININKKMLNPEYKSAVDERKKEKIKLRNTRAKLAKQLLKNNNNKSTKMITGLKNEIRNLETIIEKINERLNYLPEKILKLDYVTKNNILRLENKKKDYFDLLKFISYNVRKDISELIGPIYKNNRDIHMIIKKWLKSKCTMQKINDKLIIKFSIPGKQNERDAFQLLCEKLNSMNYRHFNTGEIMYYCMASSL